MANSIHLKAVVERHRSRMPRYVVVPSSAVAGWELDGTTIVGVTLNEVALGRRSLKRWDEARWFMDLPDRECRRAKVSTGDRVEIVLEPASAELPEELSRILSESARAASCWRAMTASQRRMLREEILAAKRPETRERRARKALGVD